VLCTEGGDNNKAALSRVNIPVSQVRHPNVNSAREHFSFRQS
jgi:hypothetical protein